MWKIITAVGASLVTIGAICFGIDQYNKREAEKKLFSEKIAKLEGRLSIKEAELNTLSARLGDKNEQVQALAGEIQSLRLELASSKEHAGV